MAVLLWVQATILVGLIMIGVLRWVSNFRTQTANNAVQFDCTLFHDIVIETYKVQLNNIQAYIVIEFCFLIQIATSSYNAVR